MSTRGEEERERLKQEYKDHYRRIKEAKEKLKRVEQKGKIARAVENMNPDSLMESVDEFLGKVRDKVTHVEARLDVAMDSLEDEDSAAGSRVKQEELDEELKKQRAKQTLKQVKAEMGMLYSEIEKHAEEIRTEKTIGLKKEEPAAEETEAIEAETETETESEMTSGAELPAGEAGETETDTDTKTKSASGPDNESDTDT